jgi:FMN phosphatase YigB (HAD superfamily)
MTESEIDAIVFDVLGTLVDETAGIRGLAPSLDDAEAERLLSLWQRHVDRGPPRRTGSTCTPTIWPTWATSSTRPADRRYSVRMGAPFRKAAMSSTASE